MRTHTKEQPFACQSCKRRFTLKHSMVRHIAKKHGGDHEQQLHHHQQQQRQRSRSPSPRRSTTAYDDDDDNSPSRGENHGTDTGLIGTLLGIRDNTVIDQVLQTKSPEDAAKMLGIKNND